MSREQPLVVIDCQVAGVSGDMVLGALLDLGADVDKVVNAMKSVECCMERCKNLEVTVREVVRKGIRAKKVDVKAEENHEVKGTKLIEDMVKCVKNLRLSEEAEKFALNVISTLVEAEAKVHGECVEEVHLHEAGSADTLAEIVGITVALEDLNLFGSIVYSTPVAVGGGLFRFSHGTVSSPAPATMEILRSKGFPLIGGPVEAELATPTGVSILVNLTNKATKFYPMMKPISIGYGAGTKDYDEIPNVLRITLGESSDGSFLKDEIYVLETNIDDVSGEIIGHAIGKLLQEGAKEVSVIPMFTKKNRPGQIIKVIADKTCVEHLVKVLIDETGTLGVRLYQCERRILERASMALDIPIGDVRETVNVKISKNSNGEIIQIKPEYSDVKKVANKVSKPLREIVELVRQKAREKLLEG